jgi:hypothetical protein
VIWQWGHWEAFFAISGVGGYIWSPKADANGARNVSYDNLSRCQRGDVAFSYANGRISQLGLVETAAVTVTKPPEFGSAGENWSQEGWLVRVHPVVLAEEGAYTEALLDDMQRLGQGLMWRGSSSWWRATSNPGDPATTANG